MIAMLPMIHFERPVSGPVKAFLNKLEIGVSRNSAGTSDEPK
jgi:hypothetical protein